MNARIAMKIQKANLDYAMEMILISNSWVTANSGFVDCPRYNKYQLEKSRKIFWRHSINNSPYARRKKFARIMRHPVHALHESIVSRFY